MTVCGLGDEGEEQAAGGVAGCYGAAVEQIGTYYGGCIDGAVCHGAGYGLYFGN